ncbi:hypothetical protein Tco_0014465, partial [Tanacetum coccineum]
PIRRIHLEDTAYPCLNLPKTTKETSPIRRIQKKAIRRIKDIVCEDYGRYQAWSLLQETPIRHYLELRQKLKEEIRKKQQGSDSRVKKSKLPYDNFGSFFGPSEPVIAQRVIEVSKSLVENPHLVEKVLKAKSVNQGDSSNLAISKPRPNANGHSQKVDIRAKPKAKVEMIKNTRDYSFILSDDAELLVA